MRDREDAIDNCNSLFTCVSTIASLSFQSWLLVNSKYSIPKPNLILNAAYWISVAGRQWGKYNVWGTINIIKLPNLTPFLLGRGGGKSFWRQGAYSPHDHHPRATTRALELIFEDFLESLYIECALVLDWTSLNIVNLLNWYQITFKVNLFSLILTWIITCERVGTDNSKGLCILVRRWNFIGVAMLVYCVNVMIGEKIPPVWFMLL